MRWPAVPNSFLLRLPFGAFILFWLVVTYGIPNRYGIIEPWPVPLTAVDNLIPLQIWTIWIYVGTYFTVGAVFLTAKERDALEMFYTLIFSGAVSFFFFTFLPTSIDRTLYPIPEGATGLSVALLNHIRSVDVSVNCAPSMHVVMGWVVVLGTRMQKRWIQWLGIMTGLAIIYSTMSTKQHYFLDAVAGTMLAFGAYMGARKQQYRPLEFKALLSRASSIALFCLFTSSVAFAANANKKVLVVVTGASELPLKDGGVYKTGYWLEEFSVPYKHLKDQGFELTIATPNGNRPTVDQASVAVDEKGKPQYWPSAEELNQALELKKFVLDEGKVHSLKNISDKDLTQYDAVFFPGGHGPMADMLNDKHVARVLNHFHKNKKTTALVCHAPAVLVSTKGKNFPYKGYKVTAFTDTEEKQTPVGPKMKTTPQKELSAAGTIFVEGPAWQSHVVEDRELLTGQNPSSSKAIAEAITKRLLSK